jgi:hypothetical protein
MATILNSPSTGQSEVLDVIKENGRALNFQRLCERVQWHYGVADDTAASFPTTVSTVLGALQSAGYVAGTTAAQDRSVDLTAGVPAASTWILLTGTGLPYTRHLAPRPRRQRA